MKMDGVRLRARKMGIKVSRRKKKDIIRDIQVREGNSPCYLDTSIVLCDQFGCCWRDDCRSQAETVKT